MREDVQLQRRGSHGPAPSHDVVRQVCVRRRHHLRSDGGGAGERGLREDPERAAADGAGGLPSEAANHALGRALHGLRHVRGTEQGGMRELGVAGPPPTRAPSPGDALEGKGPRMRPQKRLDWGLAEGAKAVGGGYCRLQMPLKLALAVRETVAGHRPGALQGGDGGLPSPLPMHPYEAPIPGMPMASSTPAGRPGLFLVTGEEAGGGGRGRKSAHTHPLFGPHPDPGV